MNNQKIQSIEWDCQKVLRQYYHLMDQRNYKDAVKLFSSDIHWEVAGLDLRGRKAVENAFGGLSASSIRHILTNTIVDVIDNNNASATSYVTIYVEKGFPESGPISFEGPNRLGENHDKLVRTKDEWLISHRTGPIIFGLQPKI